MSRKHESGLLRLAIIFMLVPLLTVGCGSDDQPDDTPTEQSATPSTTEDAGGDSRPGGTSPEQAATPSTTEDAGGDSQPDSADSVVDKPVPTGPPATMYPTRASIFDSDGDGFMTADELRRAVETRFNEFEWPAGYTTSPELLVEPILSAAPAEATYENRGEYAIIGFPHMCAWGYTWLQAFRDGDQPTMDAAMNQLTTVTLELPTFELIRDTLEPMFAEAKLGSPAELQQFLDTNCDMSVFTSTPQVSGSAP